MQNETVAGFQLSPQQKRLWLLQQESSAYRAQCAILLEGDLEAEALKGALRRVVARHEIFRTTFKRRPGMKMPLQVVTESDAAAWRDVDLSGGDSREQQAQIERLFREERDRPFDFEHGPLLRSSLLRVSTREHVLLLSLPALCADVRTLKNLLQEVSRSYAACLRGGELPGEPLQYADFSEWQNELLGADDESAEAGKAYWREQDVSSLPALTLPFERKAGGRAGFAPDSLTVAIDAGAMAKIEAIVRKNDASVAAFLLACWQTLLWRLTGQAAVVTANLSDGRKFAEFEEAMGPFAKWLPVRSQLKEDLRFSEVLGRVEQSVGEAREWQEYFSRERGDGVERPGDVTVGFEFEEQVREQRAADVTFSVYRQYSRTEHFKIKLSCVRADASLSAEVEYDPQYFARADIERIAGYFATLLGSAVENPEAAVSELDVLGETERHHLLVALNQTAADYPHEKCIHELFEEQAARTPDNIAVLFKGHQLTYAELNARANQLARVLRRRGIGPDAPVGLCLERSAELLIGLLGILKAGGAYVPLNPEHPKARLSHQLTEIQSPVLLTQEKLLSRLPDFEGEMICLDGDQALFENEQRTNLESITAPHHLVYVIYTSGSTGVPKGVAVSHQSLVNYTHFMCQKLQGSSKDGALNFATVSTIGADLGNTCIFPSLVSGGCLHVIAYEVAADAGLFADYVSRHAIDVLKIVPSHLSALLASPEGKELLPRKYLILGGEALSWELVERIREAAGGCEVMNHYGPTETTIGSLTFNLGAADSRTSELSATVPVGRPVANTDVYILDRHVKPVPVGVPGQLHIGGAGLARGYLNQPGQTTERFVPHPFSDDHNARLYKTGDLARYLPDGAIEYLGRVDYQVKIRGYRIEPGEIEAVLRRHEGVREAVVLAREDDGGDKRLVAYVVFHAKEALTQSELRSYLRERLPEYMLPAAFVPLEALPLTRNGKIDREALPAPGQERPEPERAFTAPRTRVEETLAEIWAEMLRLERVSIDDNFFELGGHSLLVTQVISRVRSSFQVALPLRALFESPTVAGLAVAIAQSQAEGTKQEEVSRMLAELEGLSDEEAQRLLTVEMRPNK